MKTSKDKITSKRLKRKQLNDSNRIKNLVNAINDLRKKQIQVRARVKQLNEHKEPKEYGVGEIRPDGGVLHEDGYIRYPGNPSLLGYD